MFHFHVGVVREKQISVFTEKPKHVTYMQNNANAKKYCLNRVVSVGFIFYVNTSNSLIPRLNKWKLTNTTLTVTIMKSDFFFLISQCEVATEGANPLGQYWSSL